MKLLRNLKEKRYLILTFTLPAILLALAIVFLQPAHNHAKVQVKVGTKQSSSSKPKASSSSSTPAVVSAPTPSSAQETYQAPQYNYVPPTTYTESHSDASSYTAPAYSADVSSGTTE